MKCIHYNNCINVVTNTSSTPNAKIVYLNNKLIFLGGPETEDQTRLRFQVELEFVQCLANPNYLNCEFVFKI